MSAAALDVKTAPAAAPASTAGTAAHVPISNGAAAASTASAAPAPAPTELDTVVGVIAPRGVNTNRVEPNIDVLRAAGLLVVDRNKLELTRDMAAVLAGKLEHAMKRDAEQKSRSAPGGRKGPGVDISIDLANVPDAKNVTVELFISRTGHGQGQGQNISTQTETISDNPNPHFQTALFLPARPFDDFDSKDGVPPPAASAVTADYELRVINRANAVAGAPGDLLAIVPLDYKTVSTSAVPISTPLANSNRAVDDKLKQANASLTIRVAPPRSSYLRPDRVLLSITGRNFPTPQSVSCLLVPVEGTAAADNKELRGRPQKTEAIVGDSNPKFQSTFSVPRPPPSPTVGVATALGPFDVNASSSSTSSASTPQFHLHIFNATPEQAVKPSDLMAIVPIDVKAIMEAPAGCISFPLEARHAPSQAAASDAGSDAGAAQGQNGASQGGSWADKLRTADASVTIVAAGSQATEIDDIHALPSYDMSNIRTWTAGPVVCLLLRGANAFAKLQHLTELHGFIRELDDMYYSADTWCALRDSMLFFPNPPRLERTVAVIKPGATAVETDSILKAIDDHDFVIVARDKQRLIDAKLGKQIFSDEKDVTHVAAGVSDVLVLERMNAVDHWQLIMGPEDPAVAAKRAPWTIRGRFGRSRLQNSVYGSHTARKAREDIAALFRDPFPLQRTLALIKPNAMVAGHADAIVAAIREHGFTILAQETLRLSKQRAEQFYAEHRDQPFFQSLVAFMSSGPIMALVLSKPAAIAAWRKLIGPTRRNDALKKPESLRAQFGESDTANACHGSANPTDADREIYFFFPQLPAEVLPTDPQQLRALFTAKDAARPHAKPTKSLNDVLVEGLTALCRERPLKLEAVRWLGKWLLAHNPNKPSVDLPKEKTSTSAATTSNGKATPGLVSTISGRTAASVASSSGKLESKDPNGPPTASAGGILPALHRPRRIVWLAGAPGVGKATQAARLAKEFGFELISVGAMLRAACKSGSDYAELLTESMIHGRIVPSTIVVRLLQEAMAKAAVASTSSSSSSSSSEIRQWLITDFPMSLDQAFDFEAQIGPCSTLIHLTADSEATLLTRLAARKQSGTAQRFDDEKESVRKRLLTYKEDVLPVIEHYRLFKKVKDVSAEGTPDQVFDRLRSIFEPKVVTAPPPPPVIKKKPIKKPEPVDD